MTTAQRTLHNSSRPRLMTCVPLPPVGMPFRRLPYQTSSVPLSGVPTAYLLYLSNLSVVEDDLFKMDPVVTIQHISDVARLSTQLFSTVDYPLWHGLVFVWTGSPGLSMSWRYPDCFVHNLAHQHHLGLSPPW